MGYNIICVLGLMMIIIINPCKPYHFGIGICVLGLMMIIIINPCKPYHFADDDDVCWGCVQHGGHTRLGGLTEASLS
jgi:hypothetical protein